MKEVTKEEYNAFIENYAGELRFYKGKVYDKKILVAYCYLQHYFIKSE